MSRNELCARCEHFKFKDADEQPYPQLEHGIGRCAGYDGHIAPVEPWVRWDARTCVNFGRAKDMEKRMQWISMRKRAEEGANAAAA